MLILISTLRTTGESGVEIPADQLCCCVGIYTKQKDFAQDQSIEDILNNNGLTYYKEENYIDSEKMWQTAYECDVVIQNIVTT